MLGTGYRHDWYTRSSPTHHPPRAQTQLVPPLKDVCTVSGKGNPNP